MRQDPDLVLVFTPPLVVVLFAAERAKGSRLTEAEVLAARDAAVCVRVRHGIAEALAAARHHDDIDPERCWEAWLEVRALQEP